MERRSKLHTLFHSDPKSANVVRKIGSREEIRPLSVDQAFNFDALQYDFRCYLNDNRKHVNALSVVTRALLANCNDRPYIRLSKKDSKIPEVKE